MSDPPAPQPRRPQPGPSLPGSAPEPGEQAEPPVGRHAAPEPALPPEPELGITEAAPLARRHTRRWVLAGFAAALLGGGAGVGAEFLRHRRPAGRPAPPPAELLAAVEAEQRLIADLDATTGGAPEVRAVLVTARADHVLHAAALRAAITAKGVQPSPSANSSAARGTPRTAGYLRAAEDAAATSAARRATSLTGPSAALLASIAASEATHAELLR